MRRTPAGVRQRIRELIGAQVRLWERALGDLEPWRQEGPLRWRGHELDGATLAEGSAQPLR